MGERFFFGLYGSESLDDPLGLPFADELIAFRSAQMLADEIAEIRPGLRGNTCVVVTRKGSFDTYYVSIEATSRMLTPVQRH
jgi:hypothetical protein